MYFHERTNSFAARGHERRSAGRRPAPSTYGTILMIECRRQFARTPSRYRPICRKRDVRIDATLVCKPRGGRRHLGRWRGGSLVASGADRLGRRDPSNGSRTQGDQPRVSGLSGADEYPGVGVQTSAAFAAAFDEASRCKQSRTAGAYFGIAPRRHQSGELDWTAPGHQAG